MPIRTHRGRAAVYRMLWGWPLRSPRHLAGVALVLVVFAGGLALVLPGDQSAPSMAVPSSIEERAPNPFDPASRAALPEARPVLPPLPTTSRPLDAPAEALTVAQAWVQAFLNTPEDIGSVQWAEQLQPYTTEEIFPLLQSVDPNNVPEAQVIGDPRPVSSGAGKTEVDVPTTTGVVRVLLVPTPEGWRVAGYEQAG